MHCAWQWSVPSRRTCQASIRTLAVKRSTVPMDCGGQGHSHTMIPVFLVNGEFRHSDYRVQCTTKMVHKPRPTCNKFYNMCYCSNCSPMPPGLESYSCVCALCPWASREPPPTPEISMPGTGRGWEACTVVFLRVRVNIRASLRQSPACPGRRKHPTARMPCASRHSALKFCCDVGAVASS